jgi:hypothetical protein
VAPCQSPDHGVRGVWRVKIVELGRFPQFGSSAFPHLDRRGILRAVNALRC